VSVGSLAPYTLLWPLSGVTVTALAATFSVAAFDVAVFVPPQVFEKRARYWLPLCETPGFVIVREVVVAPDTFVQFEPPFVLTCHWTDGPGLPAPAAVKVAFSPYVIDWFEGCVVTDAAVQATPTRRFPLPSEKSPLAFEFVARTVKAVEAAAAADVVLIVSVEVFDVSLLAKLTLLGLNDAVAPAGRPFALRLALKAVPVAPVRFTVTE
jgi:hypothetical protein